ncbi:beta-ketoacyl synthase N-terminal-like domain-containing protein, partial [Mycobacteroides abscessus]|nr:beta-ketoacyl synthase N-terminal-like domain-containing protein [Mycobacteroides abscessus]
MTGSAKRRAVIVAGARTPFVRAFGEFTRMDTIALADEAVRGLLDNTKVSSSEIEAIVWGGVILPAGAPNVAREIALALKLGHGVEGHTVTRACASGLQAITTAAAAIERGEYDVMIAGGSDSTSNAGVNLPQKLIHAAAPLALGKPKPKDYLDAAWSLAPFTGLLPRRPKIEERTTGEV